MINDFFSQFLMLFNNGFWFYSMMGGRSTWQWVFLNSPINFWSFDTHDNPGCASAVFADNQSENEIWNRLKQFLPVWVILKQKVFKMYLMTQMCMLSIALKEEWSGETVNWPQKIPLGWAVLAECNQIDTHKQKYSRLVTKI